MCQPSYAFIALEIHRWISKTSSFLKESKSGFEWDGGDPFRNVQLRTSWMGGHAWNPFAVGHQLLGELLFDEVVYSHVALSGHKEIWPDGVEGHALHQTLVLAEGVLRPAFAHLVDDHLEAAAVIRHDACQVVAFPVPCHLPHSLQREKREKAGSWRSEVKVILWYIHRRLIQL